VTESTSPEQFADASAVDVTTRNDAAEDAVSDETATSANRSTSSWGEAERARERVLLATLTITPAKSAEHARIRDELVTLHLPLVEYLARRFRDRGEPLEDLVQVGTIGLIKSVDRFDRERGVEFSTYATPTIVGEIKRHFRDKGWSIRVPRRLQEMRLALNLATADLTQDLGRSPTARELAARLGVGEEEVLEGLVSAQAYSTLSLDAPSGSGDDDGSSITDRLGEADQSLEGVELRESLRPLLAALPSRERHIIALRFFQGLTQSQIAEQVGLSQMHVSRLLAKSLAQLRGGLSD
jgi:RNA polymerase sigma-B factor